MTSDELLIGLLVIGMYGAIGSGFVDTYWPRMKRASRWLRTRMFVRVPDVDPMPRARTVGRSSRRRRGQPRP